MKCTGANDLSKPKYIRSSQQYMTPRKTISSLGQIDLMVIQSPRLAFEELMRYASSPSFAGSDERGLAKVLKICLANISALPVHGDDLISLLDDSQAIHNKLLCSCLLRLLATPGMEWMKAGSIRPRVVKIFDTQLEEVYKFKSIDVKQPAHRKIEQLEQLVLDREHEWLSNLEALKSFDGLGDNQHHLMTYLNDKLGRVLIKPFLPSDVENGLKELYRLAKAYISEQNSLAVLDAHRKVIAEIESFGRDLKAANSICADQLNENLVGKIRYLTVADFASNEAAQPAKLKVGIYEKKYPFHKLDAAINLGVSIKNLASGYAYEGELDITVNGDAELEFDRMYIGTVDPLANHFIEFPIKVKRRLESLKVVILITWRNFDGTVQSEEFEGAFEAQRDDLDWVALREKEPYSLEPITTQRDLIGRQEVLNRLLANARASNVGSSIIYGQRRVGKTSIAKALCDKLAQDAYMIIYLEMGDWIDKTAEGSINRLGMRLCKEIRRLDQRLHSLSVPIFDGSLGPLTDFLDEVSMIVTDRRIVIVLDEFDELKRGIYEDDDLGDAFFLTLRSISSKPQVGFVLVGGEQIPLIIDRHGQRLNKWSLVKVDYFTRGANWTDYRELVTRPVSDCLEYSDDAILALHEKTAGNPYFTNKICGTLFRAAIDRRDCDITRNEVNLAVQSVVQENCVTMFQHFWADGISERDERIDDKSIRRRKILIALSDALTLKDPAPKSSILDHSLTRHLSTAAADLNEFVSRGIILQNTREDTYSFKVELLKEWLKRQGVSDIITTFIAVTAVIEERKELERIKVKPQEIGDLVEQWVSYKNQSITENTIRAWIEQFGGMREQRLAMTLLKGVRYYTGITLRNKMLEIDTFVKRGLVQHRGLNQQRRSEVLVSYLDHVAKSGAHCARLYATAASIYMKNVVEKSQLQNEIKSRGDVQALLFVDDIIATGDSASSYLKELNDCLSQIDFSGTNIKIILASVVATQQGCEKIQEEIDKLGLPVQTYFCDILGNEDKCFDQKSRIYPDLADRELAKELILGKGKNIEKHWPLGYGECELAVAFEHGCPNNSLPVLWATSANPPWKPLFRRH